jgi:outer membrane immunogenic protein
MKKIWVKGMLLGVLAIPALCAASKDFKGEADFKGEVVKAPPAFCWSGIYLGGNLGGKWGKFTNSVSVESASLPLFLLTTPAETISVDTRQGSFTGGAQVGYNLQYKSLVLGIENDLNGMRLSDKETLGQQVTLNAENFDTQNFAPGDSFRLHSYWQSSLRAKIGYAQDNWLVYLTGGLALTDIKIKADFVQVNNGFTTFPETTGASSRVFLGGTIGVGTEFALPNDWSRWSVGGEYRYTAYQTKSMRLAMLPTIGLNTQQGPLFVYAPVTARVRLFTNELLFKINYHFA